MLLFRKVALLFGLLDYASWRDDPRPWRLLARDLAILGPADESVAAAWAVRQDWWPAYHFAAASLPHPSATPAEHALSLVGYKASVAHLLLSVDDNAYTPAALALADRAVVKTKGMSQLRKLVEKRSSLTPVHS